MPYIIIILLCLFYVCCSDCVGVCGWTTTTTQEPSSLHNRKHTKHTHATRVQNITLYSDGNTHSKQHRSKGVQPNGSPCANNHCSTRYEQSFRHNKHTHTYQKVATDQASRHNVVVIDPHLHASLEVSFHTLK